MTARTGVASAFFTTAICAALAASAAPSRAADIKPALIYDIGGKFDKSFNEGAFHGAEKFKEDTGIDFRDFEIQNDTQREQAMRKFARDGFSPIIAIGFSQASAMEKVAAEFPNTKFAIVDMVVDKPNVQSIVFKEQEGSFLVGLLAAKASKTGKVGFVGGMDIPLIRRFACGYVQGVKYANPKAEVLQNMTGTTGAAWTDPVKGGELAKSQIDRGADVVYHAAGATGVGVLRAAADAGKLGIGVDSDQDGLFPGKVLTSMLKNVNNAIYKSFSDAKAGTWKPGVSVLGLKEDGVGYRHGPVQQGPGHARHEGRRRRGFGRHHLGQDRRSTTTWPTTRARSEALPAVTSDRRMRSGLAPASAARLELVGIEKSFGPVHANRDVEPRGRGRLDPRHRGRERRRQVDPDVDRLRLLRSRWRRDPGRRQAGAHRLVARQHRARHRHGAPAFHAGRHPERARERHAGRRGRRAAAQGRRSGPAPASADLARDYGLGGRSRRHRRATSASGCGSGSRS